MQCLPANLNPRILRIGILALQDKEEVNIRYNALERKALAHGYPDAETYLRHTPRLRHRLHQCPVGRGCPQCRGNRLHTNTVRRLAAQQRQTQ